MDIEKVSTTPKPQPAQAPAHHPRRTALRWLLIFFLSLLCLHFLLSIALDVSHLFSRFFPTIPPPPLTHQLTSAASDLETCAWQVLEQHVSLLDVPPISRHDFLARQSVLADALRAAGVDAFVAEPSASTTYYANISARFGFSERPYLMVLDSSARFSYLVPQFETGRINPESQHMVFEGDADAAAVPWREELDPYTVLLESGRLGGGEKNKSRSKNKIKVMIDEHTRHMIAAGLQAVGVDIIPMSDDVKQLRAVKTEAEIAILRGINAFTLQLLRAVQGCLRLGITQEDVVATGRNLFTRAGVGEGYWALALFGSQAALPHGGRSGAVLEEGEFVLVDIGTSLHGYGSDVTRTMLPPDGAVSDELMAIWLTVRNAQTAALENTRAGNACRDADAASRVPVVEAGYGPYYTHRLGHGLGLETHEHPYLNGANHEKLRVGVVVSNEPGIYVTDEQATELGKSGGFGVRLEDPIWVTEDGGVPLTGRRAESPWDL